MRDLLNDLTERLSHPNPARRAQIQMQKPLPKRFYKTVSVEEIDGEHAVLLDGRGVRTPAKRPLRLPTAALAEIVRGEWDAQGEDIDPGTMPVTRLVNTAIDGIADDPQAVFEDILRFASNDMLFYRAGEPRELVQRQAEQWDPVLDWAAQTAGARFFLIEGIIYQEQPKAAIDALGVVLRSHDTPIELACLHTLTTLTGSALLALAFARGAFSLDEIWALAHLEEDWTIEHWGSDEEAEKRRALRRAEAAAATSAFAAMRA